jgi:uncharacterized cupredoxin-like copper-binding protein
MALSRGDKDVFHVGSLIFSGLAMVLAFVAVIVAGQAWSRSNDAKDEIHALAEGGLLGNQVNVRLQEYSMVVAPTSVKAGKVSFTIKNAGTMTHEMVLVRAPGVEALPRVTAAGGERAIGDVDEEAIPEADLPGEAEVEMGKTVTKTIALTPGTYVLICNIDTVQPDGTVLNHFQQGMDAVITAS